MPRKAKTKAALIGVFAMVVAAAPLLAADLKGPAEVPPKEFKGQQYVDSRGCVFLRGGYGGQVTWVPRITRDRKQMCGYPPSGHRVEIASEGAAAKTPESKGAPKPQNGFVAAAPIAAPIAAPAVAPPAAQAKTTAPSVQAQKPQAAAAPPLKSSPRPSLPIAKAAPRLPAAAPKSEGAGYRVVCPAQAPLPKAFALQGGGSQIFCTTGEGGVAALRSPLHPQQAPRPEAVAQVVAQGAVRQAAPAAVTYARPEPLPAGYVPVWEDDRLNPYRGPRLAEGDAAMAQIWTETIPAKPRPDLPKVVYLPPQEVSSGAAPVAVVPKGQKASAKASGKYRVQIDAFAQSANAERTAGRLAAMGYPVSRGAAKGGRLQVVYAGPFGSGAEAQAALAQLRAAGFGDAILAR